MSNDTTRELIACGWADFCEARYDAAFQIALTALGFEYNEETECFAFSEHSVMSLFKQDVAKHLASISSIEFIEALKLLIEVGRFVGRELEVLYIEWECVGITEEMWQTLDRIAIAEYGNPQQYLPKPTYMAEYEQNILLFLVQAPFSQCD